MKIVIEVNETENGYGAKVLNEERIESQISFSVSDNEDANIRNYSSLVSMCITSIVGILESFRKPKNNDVPKPDSVIE